MNMDSGTRETGVPFSEENLSALIWLGEHIPGGFFVYRDDERQELLYANQATLQLFGCDNLEEFRALTGYTFRGMVHPEEYESVQLSINEQIAERSNNNLDRVEYRILRRDGAVRWVDDYGRLAHIEGYGSVFYVFISDITQRRLAQEERRRMELALMEEKNLNEAKSSFLFNISHDIRTPMTAILGFSELARRHMGEPEQLADYLEKTVTSGQQMLLIIDDILEVNRLCSAQTALKAEPTQLREQMEILLDGARKEARTRQIFLREDVELDSSQVLADQTSLRRVLNNLISNALKFTPQQGTVTVTARQCVEGEHLNCTFTVADTGVGMSPAFMARMYDAFEREESSTQTGLFGTGLGLTIVKNLLDLMGGTISARSEKGRGSEFCISLSFPLLSAGEAPVQTPAQPAEDVSSGPSRILVVEDVEFNRTLEETLLEESGFLVECVVNGKEAVETVQGHEAGYFDLILMDIQMPVMNGYEATRGIRALGEKGSLPIVALSANARDEDRRRSRESGMDGHVAKPFDIEELVLVINEHIAASRK